MEMRTGIANECENIQHVNGYENVPVKHETSAKIKMQKPDSRQTDTDRKKESNKERANRINQQRQIKVPKKTHTHDLLIQLEESQCSAYCQMMN